MSPRLLSLVTLLLAAALQAAPSYSAASIVNAADNLAGPLAPNTIATIYGTGLAYGTKWLTADDIRGGLLPTVLPGTGRSEEHTSELQSHLNLVCPLLLG